MQLHETPAFKEWFAASKVIDADGKPQTVYHGTFGHFLIFRPMSDSHLGFHFGSAEQANKRLVTKMKNDHYLKGWPAMETLRGQNIQAVYLCLRNPLRTKDAGDWSNPYAAWDMLNRATKGAMSDLFLQMIAQTPRQERLDALVRRMKDIGHDGIVYKNTIEGKGDSWIALDSGQIKSAISGFNFSNLDAHKETALSMLFEPRAVDGVEAQDACCSYSAPGM